LLRTRDDGAFDLSADGLDVRADSRAVLEASGGGWRHALALSWVVLLALLVLGPALIRGSMLGSYDLLSNYWLTAQPGVAQHGLNTVDVIKQMIPWTDMAWAQVHSGSLPLWNPNDGLGLPLAFNWQSATFGVPSLVGYLFPQNLAFTVGIVVTLLIAGTGGYVLGLVLRLRMLGALTIVTVIELNGPLMAWLGFPQAQVMAWGGWLFAAALLILRGERRVPSIALFAVVLACAIYSGHPETLVTLLSATLLLMVVMLVSRALPARLGLPRGSIKRPALDAIVALLVGSALSAPLLLPGLQLIRSSIRSATPLQRSLSPHDALHFLFSSFDGVQVPGNYAFGDGFYYNETAAYVGVIALVLALVGLVAGVLKRRPEVLALAIVGVALAAVLFVAPLNDLADDLPGLAGVNWLRALMPMCVVLAALAGIGVDALLEPGGRRVLRIWLLGGFGAAALLAAVLWLFDRGRGLPSFVPTLAEHWRSESFVWPVVGIAVGLVVAALLLWRGRWSGIGLMALLVCETVLLVYAGAILISSSSNGYPPTSAVTQLQRTIGARRIAVGSNTKTCYFGFIPDSNSLYGVHFLDVNDPIIPAAYFSDWTDETGNYSGINLFNEFCPVISTVAQAQSLGVSYLLEPAGEPGPPGTKFVMTLQIPNPQPQSFLATPPGNEDLYSVPGSGVVTLSTGSQATSESSRVRISGTDPARLRLVTHAKAPGVLHLHITDVPGWHATIDGRPLALESSSVFGFSASVPAGTHHIEVRYWPSTFSVGLVVALVAVVGVTCALVVETWRRARRRDPARRDGATT
jgi:hypothetical protein